MAYKLVKALKNLEWPKENHPCARIVIFIIVATSISFGIWMTHFGKIENAYATTWDMALVNIDGKEYPMNYTLTGATLNSIVADSSHYTISILVDASMEGKLTIELPRNIIGSTKDGIEKPFVVSVYEEGVEEGGKTASVVEMYTSSNNRILEIQITEKTSQIVIVGTYLMPEFGVNGSLTFIILTGALTAFAASSYLLRTQWTKL